MSGFDLKNLKPDLTRRMDGAFEVLQKEFGGLRTGRASTNLLETVIVNAYGSDMPINQVGNVNVPEPRMLTVNVWDKNLVGAVERGIRDSGLGLNPAVDGQTIRVPIPPLTEERRAELSKVAGRYAEDARVAVRNVRRHAMDQVKQAEKDGDISQDEQHAHQDMIQDVTDDFVKKINKALEVKENDIMQV